MIGPTIITEALLSDHQDLTKVTKRSKAHWGYTKDQLDSWEDELTITQAYIANNKVYKLVQHDLILAYYSYRPIAEKTIYLDNLFVDPPFMGLGYGKQLLLHFELKMSDITEVKVTLDADPNAESFYLHHGYKTYNQLPSSIPGRFLPQMDKIFNKHG